MKGAIGNAFIMNMVITFILIFYSLLIGSMAYSKAYKTKNFILNKLNEYERLGKQNINSSNTQDAKDWNNEVNEYLGRIGYPISTDWNTCPNKDGYVTWKSSSIGEYSYCIYRKYHIVESNDNPLILRKYNYMALVYMKFDIPVLGQFIKIPITGETQTYTEFK